MSLLKTNPVEVEKANSGTELLAMVLLSGGLLWVVVDENVSVILLSASLTSLCILYLYRLLMILRLVIKKKSGILQPLNYLILVSGLSGMLPLIIPFHYPPALRIILVILLLILGIFNLFSNSRETPWFYHSMRLLRIVLMILFLVLLHFLPVTE